MLQEWFIDNFALIDHWHLQWHAGESVITGETGAGKSLFVDSLRFLLGARAEEDVQRDLGRKTVVSAIFSKEPSLVSFLEDRGFSFDEEALFLRRELDRNRTRAFLNDQPITQGLLREVADRLVDIHAQNAQTLLSNAMHHRALLDQFDASSIQTLEQKLAQGQARKAKLLEDLKALQISPEECEREKSILGMQIEEIEEAQLDSIDEPLLDEEYQRLSSAKEREEALGSLLYALREEHSLRDLLQRSAELLQEQEHGDKMLAPYVEQAWQLQAEAEEWVQHLSHYYDQMTIDPERLEEIDSIFTTLDQLKRKYGRDIPSILAFQQEAYTRLSWLEDLDAKRSEIEMQLQREEEHLENIAAALSKRRKQLALDLEEKIDQELAEMNLLQVSFKVDFQRLPSIGMHGYDKIQFLLSTNPGEPLRPLDTVASGGEMSRFMLALKIVFSEVQQVPTLLFDEIDTGISGRTAQVVAEKLHRLSASHQLIVITHLPQIAAMADHHYCIRKHAEGGVTISRMEALDDNERIEEQARLIGGVHITEMTRNSAAEMLLQAKERREREER